MATVGLSCGTDLCNVLYGYLANLMPVGSIRANFSRATLTTFSLLDVLEKPSGVCQMELASIFRKTSVSARIAFFVCICLQNSGEFMFPSEAISRRVLDVVLAFGQALKFCQHCRGELFGVPATVLGRLCRSTSTSLPQGACPTLCLYMAVTAPAIVDFGPRIVGSICDSRSVAVVSSAVGRLVSVFSEMRVAGQLICQFFFNGNKYYVSIADNPSAAARCPLQLSALRSLRLGSSNKRIVAKWFIHHEPVTSCPRMNDAVLQSAFTQHAAAAEWNRLASLVADRSCSLALRTECRDKMLALLPYCRSDVVQQVADVALRPQPPLDQPFYGVYVLCSPKWGKCYVGAFGFEGQRAPILRWKEHIDRCRLWSSETSKARYAGRRSALYAAMAAVGHENVVMVIVAQTTAASLAQQERTYMKALRPVFNIVAMDEDPVLHGQAARILGATTCDDVLSIADKVLRQAKPRLSASSWTALVVATAAAGDRTIAARVARRARMSRPELRKLRALPRLTFPCPVPDTLLRTLQARVRSCWRCPTLIARCIFTPHCVWVKFRGRVPRWWMLLLRHQFRSWSRLASVNVRAGLVPGTMDTLLQDNGSRCRHATDWQHFAEQSQWPSARFQRRDKLRMLCASA